MFRHITTSAVVAGLVFLGAVFPAEASSITCPTIGTFDRQASMSSVLSCHALTATGGTPKTDDVGTVLGGTWTEVGTLAGSNGSDGGLTAFVTAGSWGSLPASGSLFINDDVWARYGRAAITFHLGNGGGNPDWFFFELNPSSTSSAFQIVRLSGTGGGLSNVVLWGSSTPAVPPALAAPEPQSLLLMGAGLVALAAVMRRRRNSRH